MLKKDAAAIINHAVSENRLTYYELSLEERRILVAYLLANSDEGLANADSDLLLIQSAIAKIILKDGNNESIDELKDAIETTFNLGIQGKYDPFFADEIKTLLSEKWDDENRRQNEHFEHDVMQRTRDIKDTQRRLNGIY